MKRITVKVPTKTENKWRVSFGSYERKRNSATVIYNAIERQIQARVLKEKIAIEVKYSKGSSNETYPSLKGDYLLFCLACFLEDYLTPELLSQKYKKYSYASEEV